MADKDKKRISFSTEVIILWCALGLMVFATCEFFWWQATEFFEVKNAGDQPSELLILTLGAIGATSGLILAVRRSIKFSKQGDTPQKQLFNERLWRATELLANGEIVMRQIGMRALGLLAERTISEPDQVKLIMKIIHDFVRSKTTPPLEDKEAEDKEYIALGIRTLGIRTLGALYNKVDKSDDSDGFIKLLDFSRCHLGGANLTEVQLQGARFWRAKLQGVRFRGAKLQKADFSGAKLQRANLEAAQLQEANFDDAKLQEARLIAANLQGADLVFTELQGVDFRGAKLQGANFNQAKLQKANLRDAQLQGANFRGAQLQGADLKGANLQWVDCMAADFSDAKGLTQEQINGMIFEYRCPPILPKGLKISPDSNRRYKFDKDPNNESDFNYYFVDSDAEWSGRVAREWVREYLASIRDFEDAG